MRTTVTLDPDVEQLLHERMAAHGISFKQALNDAVRDSSTPRADYVFETPTFDLGEFKIDVTKANQIAGELEDEEIMRKWREGK
jgi:hypothetical protein